jgi:hypothetical protein
MTQPVALLALCHACCAVQELVSCGDSQDDPLPDASCLHLSINAAALTELRAMKQKQQQPGLSQPGAAAAASAGVLGAGGAAATGGLWGCAAEWAGLSCCHSGSWQLSLLYSPEELGRFGVVREGSSQLGSAWGKHMLSGFVMTDNMPQHLPLLRNCTDSWQTYTPGYMTVGLSRASCRCSDMMPVVTSCRRRGAS